MLRINQLKLSYKHTQADMETKICKTLKIPKEELVKFTIVKKSVDARKKPEIFYIYMVDCKLKTRKDDEVIRFLKNDQVSKAERVEYKFPHRVTNQNNAKQRPVIIGTGPAGLLAGYMLAMAGFAPILLERGESVENRSHDVEEFWNNGVLRPDSNVQFGEGGAGTFSDGKLNTLIKDKDGKNKKVLEIFVEHGAPKEILYDSKPHVGTDLLIDIVRSMREKMIAHGAEVRFNSKVTDFLITDSKLRGVVINDSDTIECEHVILAIGHSARDTFFKLYERQVPMEAKSFAVGLRVMHPQTMINVSQYAIEDLDSLPVASYKLATNGTQGRNVYSFCMCPGGHVVNASSEEGGTCCNGMSYSKRDSSNANSAIIVSVGKEDFPDDSPLGGIAFQRNLEKKTYELCQGALPIQKYEDFKVACLEADDKKNTESVNKQKSDSGRYWKGFSPCIKGQYAEGDLTKIFSKEINETIIEGMEQFGRSIRGFSNGDTILAGVESRTSSPVRILRDETLQSQIRGLYPCGEGAGYAGGITSAAMDGIKIAEMVAGSLLC